MRWAIMAAALSAFRLPCRDHRNRVGGDVIWVTPAGGEVKGVDIIRPQEYNRASLAKEAGFSRKLGSSWKIARRQKGGDRTAEKLTARARAFQRGRHEAGSVVR